MNEKEVTKQLRGIKYLILSLASFFLARLGSQSEHWWQAAACVGVTLILMIICIATE